MIYTCWSVKGSSGTSSLTTALALSWAREHGQEVLLVDLTGDIPAVLGVASSTPVGIGDWLAVGKNLEADSLRQLEYEVKPGINLLPRGREPLAALSKVLSADASIREIGFQVSLYSKELIGHLAADKRMVIIDCGNLWDGALSIPNQLESQYPDLLFRRGVVQAADISWAFTRSCYLSLRRMSGFYIRPTGVALLTESGRSLTGSDVAEIIGIPVALTVASDPAVMRAVDAGLLAARLPRRLERTLGDMMGDMGAEMMGEIPADTAGEMAEK